MQHVFLFSLDQSIFLCEVLSMSLPFAIMLMNCVPTFFQGPMSFDERKVIEGITLVKQYQGIILRNKVRKRPKGNSLNISKGIASSKIVWCLKRLKIYWPKKLGVNEALFHVEIRPLAKYTVIVLGKVTIVWIIFSVLSVCSQSRAQQGFFFVVGNHYNLFN